MAINLRATAVAFDSPQGLSTVTAGFAVSVFSVLMFNQSFMATIIKAHGLHGFYDYLFAGFAVIFLLAVINLLVGLAWLRFLFRFWLISLLLIGATVSCFETSCGVVVDRDMIHNVLKTGLPRLSSCLAGNWFSICWCWCWAGQVMVQKRPVALLSNADPG